MVTAVKGLRLGSGFMVSDLGRRVHGQHLKSKPLPATQLSSMTAKYPPAHGVGSISLTN